MLSIQFQKYPFRFRESERGRCVYDIIRKKYVLITPEEWVRQNLLHYLVTQANYPKGLISVERQILVNQLKKRYDIAVFDKQGKPWMLIECKEPQVQISDKTLQQLLSYHQVLQCPYWVLSNGVQHFCGNVKDGSVVWLSSLPVYNS